MLVQGGVLFIIWKFRARKRRRSRRLPEQLHGNTKLEIGWTALPAVILAFLAVFTVSTILDLAQDRARTPCGSGSSASSGGGPSTTTSTATASTPTTRGHPRGIEAPEEYETDIETATELVIPVGRPSTSTSRPATSSTASGSRR